MKEGYKVYLEPVEYLDIKEYAEAHRHTFSSFCAQAALSEMKRHPIPRNVKSCFPVSGFATENDYRELADKIRHYL